MEQLLSKHPENYSNLIHRSTVLYRASFSKVILLSLLLSIIVFLPRIFADITGQDIFGNVLMQSRRLWLLVIDLAALTVFIGILWHIHCVIVRKHEPLGEDFLVGLKKVTYAFIAAIIQNLIIFLVATIFYLLLILLHYNGLLFVNTLPGIIFTTLVFLAQIMMLMYVSPLFIFFLPLIVVENKGILSALRRSLSLVWNHWWRTFSVQITPWLYYFLLLLAIKYLFRIDVHIYFMEHGPHTPWVTVLHVIVFALFIPWTAALMLIQLNDLELRQKLAKKHK